MGMAWDTGAPLLPYQTPDTLLFAINTPAYFVAAAACNFLGFGVISPLHYVTFFSAIVAWWWLVGLYLDKRSTNETGAPRKTLIWTFFLCLSAITLII
jgi:hypothetical protein